MNTDFTNLTTENLSNEHLCCIIRSKKSHPGIEAKRQWLSDRLNEGHVFRKLNAKATVFIEYAPLETAWVPVIGDNYYYLYCLWVLGSPRGNGYGKALIEYCIADAKEKGRSGICMLGAKKQKSWLSDQSFAKKFGFEDWLKEDIRKYGLQLEPDYRAWENPIGGSDNGSFAKVGIPIIWYHTDGHPDYHQPSDHADRLNWDKVVEITKASFLNMWKMANEKSF